MGHRTAPGLHLKFRRRCWGNQRLKTAARGSLSLWDGWRNWRKAKSAVSPLRSKSPVFGINPKQLDRFRDCQTVAGAKEDSRDAFVLTDSPRPDQHCFRRLAPDHPCVIRIRNLSRTEDSVGTYSRRTVNQLYQHCCATTRNFCKSGPRQASRGYGRCGNLRRHRSTGEAQSRAHSAVAGQASHPALERRASHQDPRCSTAPSGSW